MPRRTPPTDGSGAPRTVDASDGADAQGDATVRPDNRPAPRRRAMTARRMNSDAGTAIRRPSEGRAEQIVDVAAKLFLERGYVRTSMADIADAVGILPGSLYHYIESKEDLLYTIIERAHRGLIDRVLSQPLETLSAGDAVRLTVRVHVEEIANNLNVSVASNVYLRELDADRQSSILKMRADYQRVLANLVRRGQTERAWCEHIDPVLASLTITAVGNSLTGWYDPADHRWTIDVITAQYSSMVARSLTCDHTPRCDTRRRTAR